MKVNVRDSYGTALVELGEQDSSVVALDADLSASTKTAQFGKRFPERFFNMGISEQDMVGTAAGMASCGKHPFVSTFCVFLPGRSFDQVRMGVGYPNLKVKFVSTHGGISVGKDGASHHANEDIAMMRALPNIDIYIPSDPHATYTTIKHIYLADHPCYVRLFRDSVDYLYDESEQFDPTRSHVLQEGDDVGIITCGFSTHEALKACETLRNEGISPQLVDLQVLRPLDEATIRKVAQRCGRLITVEDHSAYGGVGGAIAEFLSESYPTHIERIGVRSFTESGSPRSLYEKYGLSEETIVRTAKELTQ
ncbi:MAG TPA: transketolase family protein [Methanomicrobia archaeon]|nr:transketolase family protein [Methanomicrobia archaeon]